MLHVHPDYYSHHFQNQLISWAAALYGSTALLTVATNVTKSFFREAGFVDLTEVCRGGTRLALDSSNRTDFVAHLMLYRPPIATTKQHDENQSEDGVEAPAAGPPGGDDPEPPDSGVPVKRCRGRPLGSKNKPKTLPLSSQPETPPPDEREAAEEQESPSARFYKP